MEGPGTGHRTETKDDNHTRSGREYGGAQLESQKLENKDQTKTRRVEALGQVSIRV